MEGGAQMSEMAPFAVGDLVTWFYSPRSSQVEYAPVDGMVVGVTPLRVRIRVRLESGHVIERLVQSEHLRHRAGE